MMMSFQGEYSKGVILRSQHSKKARQKLVKVSHGLASEVPESHMPCIVLVDQGTEISQNQRGSPAPLNGKQRICAPL